MKTKTQTRIPKHLRAAAPNKGDPGVKAEPTLGIQGADDRPEARELLKNIKAAMPSLRQLLTEAENGHAAEDGVYRFYHQSFKVFRLQDLTQRIVAARVALCPKTGRRKFEWLYLGTKPGAERPVHTLDPWFEEVVRTGTGRTFQASDNARWLEATRPILEVFFHARYFLEMAVKYGRKLRRPPNLLPSGWAALLYLYDLR